MAERERQMAVTRREPHTPLRGPGGEEIARLGDFWTWAYADADAEAEPGTIRGDYSLDSPALANADKRAVRNIIHASGNAEEAKYEAQLWFRESEIYDYRRVDEDVMFGKG